MSTDRYRLTGLRLETEPIPNDEYMSHRHPEWRKIEWSYVASNSADPVIALAGGWIDHQSTLIASLERLSSELAAPGCPDERYIDAVKDIGLEALHASTFEREAAFVGFWAVRREVIAAIRESIWERIEMWTIIAQCQQGDERKAETEKLTGIMRALAGDRRGKRAGTVAHPEQLRKEYYRSLFRFEQVVKFASALNRRRVDDHIAAIAEATGVPEDLVSLCVHEALTPKAAAVELAARLFDVDVHTVQNHISARTT